MVDDTRNSHWTSPISIAGPMAHTASSSDFIPNKESIMIERIAVTIKDHLTAHAEKHMLNIELMLNNPMSIPEHTDLVEAIEHELGKMSEYVDKLEALRIVLGEDDL